MGVERDLIVIGHKNPDTDSICSAIAYARFKSDVQQTPAHANRARNVNAQTAFALEHFDARAPALLGDVYPRVSDIMVPRADLLTLSPSTPLGEAKVVMLERRFSFLPVVDKEDCCVGKVSALGIAGILDELDEPCTPRELRVGAAEYLRRVRGTVVSGGPIVDDLLIGKLLLGQPDESEFGRDRSADALIAIGSGETLAELDEYGPKIKIYCGGEPPAPETDGPLVIHTPLGVVQAAIELFYATPCEAFLEPTGPRFASADLLRDVQFEINKSNLGGFVVDDSGGKLAGVVTRTNFMLDPRRRVVLVDHNEYSQAVEGIESAELVEVIDHHRIGSLHTNRPITVINRVIGSTCSIVADLYRSSGQEPDRATAGLLLSGVLSDTVILRGPTTTQSDREIAPWLARRAGVEIEVYGEQMFRAGSNIAKLDAEAVIGRDQKAYTEAGIHFSVSQIEMIGFSAFWDRKQELFTGLSRFARAGDYDMAFLMVTDITVESTLLVCHASERVLDLLAYPQVEPGIFELKGVLSRKKQVLPLLIDVLGRA